MSAKRSLRTVGAGLLGVAFLLAACGAGSGPSYGGGGTSPTSTEAPVATESSPPGDIPDDTVFIAYRADGGFGIQVPEGWGRTNADSSVTFTDNLNTVTASWSPASSTPTVDSATQNEVPPLQGTERAFQLQDVTSVSLPGGDAVLITFQENSPPNPVTGKQYRLDVERFEFFRDGTEAVLTLSSPVGADNVDPWRIVSESFAWS